MKSLRRGESVVKGMVAAAALAILLAGMGGILLVPERRPSAGAAGGAQRQEAPDGAPEGELRGSGRSRMPQVPYLVVEQVSPIIRPDGTLGEALGVEMPGDAFKTLLPRGTSVPATRTSIVSTLGRGHRGLLLHVLRGTSDRATENQSLGWYRVAAPPEGTDGRASVAVVFGVVDGAIVMGAVDPQTRQILSVERTDRRQP